MVIDGFVHYLGKIFIFLSYLGKLNCILSADNQIIFLLISIDFFRFSSTFNTYLKFKITRHMPQLVH